MKLFLCPNDSTELQARQARECIEILETVCGHECALPAPIARELQLDKTAFSAAGSDLIVSLGGDGAVLRAARLAIAEDKPLIGINSGRLGYLCALDLSQVRQFNDILPACARSRRFLLQAACGENAWTAVNDIVIAKRSFGEIVDLSVCIDGGETLRLRGDGLIFATPTGSTAYNCSARGPLTDPELGAFILTPICPHGTFDHSLVLGAERSVQITAARDSAVMYVDGAPVDPSAQQFSVRAAPRVLTLYSSGHVRTGFLKLL